MYGSVLGLVGISKASRSAAVILASVRGEPAFGFMVVALVLIFGPTLARRARLPGLIGLLVGGALVGPEVLGVIEKSAALEAVGEIGVLYLVFLAGLELDLKTFRRYRTASLSFGLLTSAAPWALGTAVALAFDIDMRAAILVGSFWASFTLVSYGVVSHYRLTRVPSVAATVGASAITDTIGLVTLAVIAGATTGGSGGIRLGIEIAAGLAGVILFTSVVLPAIVRWFFAGMGQERELRFVMIFAGFTGAAVVAEVLAIEALIGAFFAGIGLNRLVPNQSALMARTAFFGNAIFIPTFIVSVGLLVDPAVMADVRTIGLAAGFAGALLIGKAAAAATTGLLYGFPRAEIGLMFSLSSAQAAATLASTIIGFEIGLYESDIVNAVVIVIVISLFTSAVGSNHFAPEVRIDEEGDRRLGETILIPSTDERDLTPLLRLAGRLAEQDAGLVVPVVVAADGDEVDVAALHRRVEQLDDELRSQGLTGDTQLRVDRSIAGGVARAAIEREASLIFVPWSRDDTIRNVFFGGTNDEIAAATGRPIALASIVGTAVNRILLPLEPADLKPSAKADTAMAVELASLLSARGSAEIVVGPIDPQELIEAGVELPEAASWRRGGDGRLSWLVDHLSADDLIVAGARGGSFNLLRAEALGDRSVVITSAHQYSHWYASEAALGWGRQADPRRPSSESPAPLPASAASSRTISSTTNR